MSREQQLFDALEGALTLIDMNKAPDWFVINVRAAMSTMPPAQPSNAAPAPPVPEDGPMMVRGTNANGVEWIGTMRQVMEDYKQAAEIEAREADRLRQRIAELESPPVPDSVQEIMRLMMPYVRACLDFATAFPEGELEGADAACAEALKPLQAALTALVDDNHRLKFELDGVNATRPAPSMTTMQAIYAKAWMRAADWANRHDLHSDVGSPAYLKDMASELAEFADAAMDGVNAMRRQEWICVDVERPVMADDDDDVEVWTWDGASVREDEYGGIFEQPAGPAVGGWLRVGDGFAGDSYTRQATHWMPRHKPLPPPPTNGIEPEQGESHE